MPLSFLQFGGFPLTVSNFMSVNFKNCFLCSQLVTKVLLHILWAIKTQKIYGTCANSLLPPHFFLYTFYILLFSYLLGTLELAYTVKS